MESNAGGNKALILKNGKAMNSSGGQNRNSSQEVQASGDTASEGKSESKLAAKTEATCRRESISGLEQFTEQFTATLDNQKTLRNMSVTEQFEKTGKVKLGVITRNFQGSMGLYEGDKALVPERTPEQIATIRALESASQQGMLIGDGGKFVQVNNTHQSKFDALSDALKTESSKIHDPSQIAIGNQSYSRDQLIAYDKESMATDAVDHHLETPKCVLEPGDSGMTLGSKNYIIRHGAGRVDKFGSKNTYIGSAVDSASGELFKAPPGKTINFQAINQEGDVSSLLGKSIKFVDITKKHSGNSDPDSHLPRESSAAQTNVSPQGGDAQEVQSSAPRPPQNNLERIPSIQRFDGSMPLKGIVDESGEQKELRRLQPYVDASGEVPFGERMPPTFKGHAQDFSSSYYTFTLGVVGKDETGKMELNNDVLNINIGDALKVDGRNITDGQPHRHVFPIKPSAGNSHWRWIDATLTAKDSNHMELSIHKLSPSRESTAPNTSDATKWDEVNLGFILPRSESPRHVDAQRFNGLFLQPGENPTVRLEQRDLEWYSKSNHNRIAVTEKKSTRD